MARCLVETYVPGSGAGEAREAGRRARALARDSARGGVTIRYVRMTFVPGGETCFHLFEAASEETVADLCRRAGLGSPRIVPAVE